ncbi:ABC transporter permease [Xylocopilactobacillus apis]|uniref:Lantibiotic ABC transporter permease n=1 Tax=Xylocopilactobacillus apis TaxID=2932183 RepID=A0AAU9CW07_9LACO|nr:ABC transporter permease [Xylocopilactobacillus apis]BDR56601.1 lantibiotic ABC transporter permease [Xylocopilactobacillus apis]
MKSIKTELLKIISNRIWWIVVGLVIFLQPLLGMLEARNFAAIGLHATPATNSKLIEAIPPLNYIGFDSAMFGIMPMVVMGSIIGAIEFKNHNLRISLLSENKRLTLFVSKILSFLILTAIVSLISIYLTIAVEHLELGKQGLNPIILSSVTWKYIGLTTINWTLLTTLSFGIGFLFKTMIIPLVFMIPQVYNLGAYLAEKWEWGHYLPVAAGDYVNSISSQAIHNPIKGITILLIWLIITFALAGCSLKKLDLGGKY